MTSRTDYKTAKAAAGQAWRAAWQGYRATVAHLGLVPTTRVVAVSIGQQQAQLWQVGSEGSGAEAPEVLADYVVSTGKVGPSCLENSGGTPWGLHVAEQKIGAGAPLGTVFVGRRPVADHFCEVSAEAQQKNLITTRIVWLRGLEEGLNAGPGCDTFARYIYLHGTNHEDRLGTPSSGGCVQFANHDIALLFDLVAVGDHVWLVRE